MSSSSSSWSSTRRGVEGLEAKQGEDLLNNSRGVGLKEGEKLEQAKGINMHWWVPHPRNGIYYPKGHEWVMNDVPESAAGFCQAATYWLRGAEGVDDPSSDFSVSKLSL